MLDQLFLSLALLRGPANAEQHGLNPLLEADENTLILLDGEEVTGATFNEERRLIDSMEVVPLDYHRSWVYRLHARRLMPKIAEGD